jgi:hypothetical protein
MARDHRSHGWVAWRFDTRFEPWAAVIRPGTAAADWTTLEHSLTGLWSHPSGTLRGWSDSCWRRTILCRNQPLIDLENGMERLNGRADI